MSDAKPLDALLRYIRVQNREAGSVLFLNAEVPKQEDVLADFRSACSRLNCEQPQRSKFLQLQDADFLVTPELNTSECSFDEIWVLLEKFKALNEHNIVRALKFARDGGRIIVCGAKHSGITSLKKWLSEKFEIDESYSKYHSQLFVFTVGSGDINRLAISHQYEITNKNKRYQTAPGLFCADRIDIGSKLLCDNLNFEISGSVADLGSGWGYLSHQLLSRYSAIKQLHLFENEWQGLEVAKFNLEPERHESEIMYSWRDIVREPIELEFKHHFDWVVMNPPFHEGQSADVSLGEQFIIKSAKILKPSGCLLMVSNRKLPYENVLRKAFGNIHLIEETSQFKVILAKNSRL